MAGSRETDSERWRPGLQSVSQTGPGISQHPVVGLQHNLPVRITTKRERDFEILKKD